MSEIKVDTVAEKTSANGVTVDGLNIKDSKLVTANSVVTSNITDANITTDKLAATSVTAAKLNADIISGTTELTSEPADTDEFILSDNGVLKRIDYSLIKATAPGFVKLVTTTLSSGASQIDFDSTYITTDYLNYLAVFNCQPSQDSVTFNFRVATSGSFKTGASDYGHGYASDGGNANDNDRDNLNLNGTTGNATGETVSGFIYCFGLTSATYRAKFAYSSHRDTPDGLHGYVTGGGSVNAGEVHNGIRFYFSSGNVDTSSTITLYGINT